MSIENLSRISGWFFQVKLLPWRVIIAIFRFCTNSKSHGSSFWEAACSRPSVYSCFLRFASYPVFPHQHLLNRLCAGGAFPVQVSVFRKKKERGREKSTRAGGIQQSGGPCGPTATSRYALCLARSLEVSQISTRFHVTETLPVVFPPLLSPPFCLPSQVL